jgi:hypothetical protein
LSSFTKGDVSWVWWFILVIPALRCLRQEDLEFEAKLGYTVRLCLRRSKEKKKLKKGKLSLLEAPGFIQGHQN